MNFRPFWQSRARLAGVVSVAISAYCCGTDIADENTSTRDPASWSDVKAVLATSCAVSGCHSTAGGQNPNLETADADSFWDIDPLDRINSTENPMPPDHAATGNNPNGITLSAADRTTLIDFLTD